MFEDLTDLRDRIKRPTLDLPVGGVRYSVPRATAAACLVMELMASHLNKLQDDPDAKPDPAVPDDPQDLWRLALGGTFDDDGKIVDGMYGALSRALTLEELQVAGLTAFLWQIGNAAAAAAVWADQGKAPEPVSTSTSTAGASSTPRRARGSGTTSRTKSSTGSKPRRARPGGASSATGV